MLGGLITFLRGQKYLHGHAEPKDPELLTQKSSIGLSKEWTIYLCALVGVVVIWQMLQFHAVVGVTLNVTAVAVLVGLGWFITVKCDAV